MSDFTEEVRLFTDGGSRGNPGPGAIAVLILDGKGDRLTSQAEVIGQTTNNRAEYRALIKGLELCAEHTRKKVVCFLDSQLVVNQMSGAWRLKNNELRGLFHEVKKCEQVFEEVVYTHVSRENPNIRKVDRALNEALEGR